MCRPIQPTNHEGGLVTTQEFIERMAAASAMARTFETAMRGVEQVARTGQEVVAIFRRAFPNDVRVVTTQDGGTRLVVRHLGGFTPSTPTDAGQPQGGPHAD